MPCYRPLQGYRAAVPGPNGRRGIVFNKADAFVDRPFDVPCGQCVGCRLERSRQWALRCKFEAQMHAENCFLTLTYNDENLPDDLSLNLRHWQLFMKKLRKRYNKKIRFFHCGEYGEGKGERKINPHYHAIIFGHDFDDKKLHKITHGGHRVYTSETLDRLWSTPQGSNMGHSLIGDVTFDSAAYVARYCLKKVTGEQSEEFYRRPVIHPVTGEVCSTPRRPEYATMSRRPGIGLAWLERFQDDVYPSDFVVENGVKMRPPKYFDKQLEKSSAVYGPPNLLDRTEYQKVKAARKSAGQKNRLNNQTDRLMIREAVKLHAIDQLKREI